MASFSDEVITDSLNADVMISGNDDSTTNGNSNTMITDSLNADMMVFTRLTMNNDSTTMIMVSIDTHTMIFGSSSTKKATPTR